MLRFALSPGAMTIALPAAALAVVASFDCRPRASPRPLTVAAAADLAQAFRDVGRSFERETGIPVTFSFGSTGLLARQIAEGAPFDLFAAADRSFVDDVVKAGVCDGRSIATYARGRVVAWTRDEDHAVASLSDLLDPKFVKIAMANPEHAPYGRAARQALERAGLWGALEPRIVYGENVQQAMQFAQSGNAEIALVALSLALNAGGKSLLVGDTLHDPLDQALVVCGQKQDAAARRFAGFVASTDGRAILRRYGFLLPGEALPGERAPAPEPSR